MSGTALAAAAEALAGTRFRLHGRDPATGLDCIGLLAAALRAIGREAVLPSGYPLRTHRLPDPAIWAEACGFVAAEGAARAGDVLLLRAGPCQVHFAIVLDRARIVHAHAGRGRVIIEPGPPGGTVVAHWRLAPGTPAAG